LKTKPIIISIFLLFFNIAFIYPQVIITEDNYNSAHLSSLLHLVSEDKGLLLPLLNSEERDNIEDPAESLIIYNIETVCIEMHLSGIWYEIWCKQPFKNCGDNFYYEGKLYPTVKIGNQCWFAENLNIGTRIDHKDENEEPQFQGTSCDNIEKYCYDDDDDNCEIYGGLYQWDQAMCGETEERAQGICPDGWHIPSHDDWTTLERSVCETAGHDNCETQFPYDNTTNGYRGTDEAIRMACNDNELWIYGNLVENQDILNQSGLSLIPGGFHRSISVNHHQYQEINYFGRYYTSTEYSEEYAWYRMLHENQILISRQTVFHKTFSYSIRCIKEL